MAIKIMKKENIKEVARIHYESLPQDFLPSLGTDFLEKVFYPNTLDSSFGITFIKTIDGEIAGFLTIAYKSNLFLRNIMFNNFYQTSVAFIKKILSKPFFLKECLGVLSQIFLKEDKNIKSRRK